MAQGIDGTTAFGYTDVIMGTMPAIGTPVTVRPGGHFW